MEIHIPKLLKNKISHGERPELKVLKIKIYFTGSKNNVLPDVNTSLSKLLEACIGPNTRFLHVKNVLTEI